MPERFTEQGLEEVIANLPEKAREKAFAPMTDEEAAHALQGIAKTVADIGLPFRKTGDTSDTDLAERWEQTAESIRQISNKGTLDEVDAEVLRKHLDVAERSIEKQKKSANGRRYNELMREWNTITRLRRYLDDRLRPEAAE